jgi:hypothetical protein
LFIELNDALADRAAEVEDMSQVYEGYGLRDGMSTILFSSSNL